MHLNCTLAETHYCSFNLCNINYTTGINMIIKRLNPHLTVFIVYMLTYVN